VKLGPSVPLAVADYFGAVERNQQVTILDADCRVGGGSCCCLTISWTAAVGHET